MIRKFREKLSLTVVLIFVLNFHLLPLAHAITVEEQAGKKRIEKERPVIEDLDKSKTGPELFGRVVEERPARRQPAGKDPRLACLLSLVIPGGGHIYLRRDLKGIGFCLAAGTGYTVTGYYLYRSFVQDKGADFRSKVIVSGLLFFISALIHVVGIVEAYSDAEEMNKRSFYGINDPENPYASPLVIR
jgi:hypothetical protein